MQLPFVKMHGLGNDFVVVRDLPENALPEPGVIRALAHRREGIGFDQMLWIGPPRTSATDAFVRVFNADGGEVGQCGNGMRAIALLIGNGKRGKHNLKLESAAGVFEARILGPDRCAVCMGEPHFAPEEIPFRAGQASSTYPLEVDGEILEVVVLSMGNPHCVLLVEDVGGAPIERLGPAIESHAAFPERCNAGFLEVVDRHRGRLRVYERGVGETLACGSGACAAMVAGRELGHFDDEVELGLPGGDLVVSWRGPGTPVWLTGPAEISFEGSVNL